MNDNDNDNDFDASRLQRLDRPRRPLASAQDKIRQQMLDAFDEESNNEQHISIDTPDSDTPVLELKLILDEPDAQEPSPNWFYRVAVAAAIVLLVGVVGVLSLEDQGEVTPAQQNETAIEDFCTTMFEDLVDVFVEFDRNPNSEFEARALRNLELLSQHYADLSDELAEPLAEDVRVMGDRFLARAAQVRIDLTVDRRVEQTPESMTLLIADLADAIGQLPGSSSCRVSDLRGG